MKSSSRISPTSLRWGNDPLTGISGGKVRVPSSMLQELESMVQTRISKIATGEVLAMKNCWNFNSWYGTEWNDPLFCVERIWFFMWKTYPIIEIHTKCSKLNMWQGSCSNSFYIGDGHPPKMESVQWVYKPILFGLRPFANPKNVSAHANPNVLHYPCNDWSRFKGTKKSFAVNLTYEDSVTSIPRVMIIIIIMTLLWSLSWYLMYIIFLSWYLYLYHASMSSMYVYIYYIHYIYGLILYIHIFICIYESNHLGQLKKGQLAWFATAPFRNRASTSTGGNLGTAWGWKTSSNFFPRILYLRKLMNLP